MTESSALKVDSSFKNSKVKLTDEQRLQLEEQIRMFVQLLTQSYLLSFGIPALHLINESSNRILEELKKLACVNSSFQAYNLKEALTIIENCKTRKDKFCLRKNYSSGMRKTTVGIPYFETKKIIYHSKVFMYPELLPRCGFNLMERKVSFCSAEDNLIALGLERFSSLEKPENHILETLIACKTAYQIKVRIKNSKAKGSLDNPIKYYSKYKKAPDFSQVVKIFNPDDVKAPKDQPKEVLPTWINLYLKLQANRHRRVNIKHLKSTQKIQKHRQLLPQGDLNQKCTSESNQKIQYFILPVGCMLTPVQYVNNSSFQICFPENKEIHSDEVFKTMPSLILPNSMISYKTTVFNQLTKNNLHSNDVSSEEENMNSNANLNKTTFCTIQTPNAGTNETDLRNAHEMSLNNDIKASELSCDSNSKYSTPIKKEIIDDVEPIPETHLCSKICNITIKREILDDTEQTEAMCISESTVKNCKKRTLSNMSDLFIPSNALQVAHYKKCKRTKSKQNMSKIIKTPKSVNNFEVSSNIEIKQEKE